MKVLQNVAAKDLADRSSGAIPGLPRALDAHAGTTPVAAVPRGPSRPALRAVRVGLSPWRALLLGGLGGSVAAGAVLATALYLRTGTLVVTSDPPGAQVQVDGRLAAPTPAVVGELPLRVPHTVVVSAPDRRTFTQTVQPDLRHPTVRIHAVLPAAVGDLVIDSDPPGAEARLDGMPLGRTPVTASGVRLGERHRVDLTMPGREIDQFVVLPETDVTRLRRTLPPPRPAAVPR